ncbi:TraB/GumN family protein [Flavisericum labens]|uniref:TraB/GumN family protein n=1 Tax=Flavisericum labens TaxID=3377112 RepID=UPI00387B7CCE
MKKLLFLFICFSSLHFYSQQKYQSLLWEVSGNGLEEPSYLYGTMHVSKKVAFRLDDVFFKALNNSESVALESDPSTWLAYNYENRPHYEDYNFYRKGFYTKLFELNPPEQLMIRNSIRLDNSLISNYLYRKNYGSDNFEEETYLDMFIYQAGKKKHKPIIGLEDLAESRYLTTKALYNSNKKKPDPWVIKLYEKEGGFFIQENTYRERNLDLLDSIGSATNTNYFRENMLFKRNENMVNVLDSLMKKQSVFSGVGAAHLPGERGMINMLVEKGYKLKPLSSKQTSYAKSEKEKLENLFLKPKLSLQTTPDKFLSIKSFDTLREFSGNGHKYYIAPDMTNGAFLAISRISTFEYLPHKESISLEKIDHLLYEDIPGTILKKEHIEYPFPGISVLNQTKKGDYQKYHIYQTPLEIIIVKFGGKKDFVKQYEEAIFNSITFKVPTDKFVTYTDPFKKYSVSLPENHITQNIERAGKKLIQAKQGDDYYFVQESPYNDIEYIEEDAFEAQYIHTSFYKNLDMKELSGHFKNSDYKSYVSQATDSLHNKNLYLKSLVKDGSYYLLGYSGKSEQKAKQFFNSLKLKTPVYEQFKKEIDTCLHFTVKSPVKPPLSINNFGFHNRKKDYEEHSKTTTYTSDSNEEITVARTKFHDLKMYTNTDSLWNSVSKIKKPPGPISENQEKLNIFNEKRFSENGINYYTHKLKDSTSNKIILVKYVQKAGVLYKLAALQDSISQPSTFITNFYESFSPMDTLLGVDIFEDKTTHFFDALKQNDSIVLTGYNEIEFSKKHSPIIIDALENHKFPEDKDKIKYHLLKELIKNDKSQRVTNYVENLYVNSYADPSIQSIIIEGLFRRNDKSSHKLVLNLMSRDLPLGFKTPSLNVSHLKADSLQQVKVLFPGLLKFTSVEEYKSPVYQLLSKLVDSNVVKSKLYKPYKDQIINDAKVEIKRSLGNNRQFHYKSMGNFTLNCYTKLLFPYRNEKSVRAFYSRMLKSEDWEALSTYYVLLKKNDEQIPAELRSKTLLKRPAQHLLYTKLKKLNLLTDEETRVIDLKTLAKSKLMDGMAIRIAKDSINLLAEKNITTDNGNYIKVFIFKRLNKESNTENNYLHFIAFDGDKTEKPYYTSKRNGISINGLKTEEEVIEETMLLIKYKDRKRIKINQHYY